MNFYFLFFVLFVFHKATSTKLISGSTNACVVDFQYVVNADNGIVPKEVVIIDFEGKNMSMFLFKPFKGMAARQTAKTKQTNEFLAGTFHGLDSLGYVL